MIEFRKDRRFLLFFYIELPPETTQFGRGGNIIGAVYFDPECDCWASQLRTRHYRDGRIDKHEDPCTTQTGGLPKTLGADEVRLRGVQLAEALGKIACVKPDVVEMDCDGDQAIAEITARNFPWWHVFPEDKQAHAG